MGLLALPMAAQSACDKFFSSGVAAQQTMTVASQRNAITFFEKAKSCYDSQAKKDLCDQQIKACRNIINQLLKQSQAPASEPSPAPAAVSEEPKKELQQESTDTPEVQLSLNVNYLKFKGKGGEFKKAKVKCSSPDWQIVSKPDWVNCSRSDNELVVEAEQNPSGEERSGAIELQSGNRTVTLTVIQEKNKKFGIF